MNIKDTLSGQIVSVLQDLGISIPAVVLTYPADAIHGDLSTNIALIAAKEAKKNPVVLAEEIAEKLKVQNAKLKVIKKIEVVKPGFINFWIADEILVEQVMMPEATHSGTILAGKQILVEFAHPNTHKAFHIGHLRNITTGETIVRILEAAGAIVTRANYQGDVGMHIAKCLYGLLHDNSFTLESAPSDIHARVALLGKAYSSGSSAYESHEEAKKEIGEINKKIYAKDREIWKLYQTTRQWSLDYFESIYKRVETHFDRYYFESESYESGKKTVLEGLKKGVFEKSDGAIIFPGSSYGLHDRVFITSEGNPTYEGKDIGLAPLQFKEYSPDLIIHVVGPEQAGYFQVIFEAVAQLFPETRGKEYHLIYGWVKLKHGKMSSRTGNVILGEWLLDEAKAKIRELYDISDEVAEQVAVAAVKYSFLKVGLNQDISFDLNESVSLQGNSGPYLQYTYVRTRSVLTKAGASTVETPKIRSELQTEERALLRLLSQFSDVIEESAKRYAPNLLCTYLFELAQAFNLFYQKCPILKEEEAVKQFRLSLTAGTGTVLQKGLSLLGIEAPKRM